MKSSLLLIAISFFVLAGCGEDTEPTDFCGVIPAAKVISGEVCSLVNGPVVKLVILDEEDNEQICSATLISPDTVLTALHCFDENTFGVFAQVGDTRIPLKRLELHPSPIELPRGIFINDIALVQFETAIGQEFVTRFASEPVTPGQKVEIYGFGRSVGDDFQSGGKLRRGEMTITNVDSDFLSAEFSGIGQNTCFGDSGGPAFIQTKEGLALAGLTAFGIQDDCGVGDTSTFVNLQSPAVLDFLQSNDVVKID